MIGKLKEILNNILPDNSLGERLINSVITFIKFLFEPVYVDYSSKNLCDQIYGISIMLFIISLLLVIILVVLLWNIFIWYNKDKLMTLFPNKYIRWYITVKKEFIGWEIFLLFSFIIFWMSLLIEGLHFLATHPIIIN